MREPSLEPEPAAEVEIVDKSLKYEKDKWRSLFNPPTNPTQQAVDSDESD
jgi:hypothetical protein